MWPQLVWLAINAFLFVHFYMAFLVERWFYTRVLLGVSVTAARTHTHMGNSTISNVLNGKRNNI